MRLSHDCSIAACGGSLIASVRSAPSTNLPVVRTFGASRGLDYWSAGLVLGVMLCGELAVQQASMFDGRLFDPFALFDYGFCPAEGSKRRQVLRY